MRPRELVHKSQPALDTVGLYLYRLDNIWRAYQRKTDQGIRIFGINMQGDLISPPTGQISVDTVRDRAVVQYLFSVVPDERVNRMSYLKEGETTYGFFRQPDNSNYAIFVEADGSRMFGSFGDFWESLLAKMAIVAAVVWVGLWLAIRWMITPLKDLDRFSPEFAAGNLDVKTKVTGLGEFEQLSRSFGYMLRKIRELLRGQIERVRLEGELNIAKSIQENLLPTLQGEEKKPVEVYAHYEPATEVAGDWYGVHHRHDSSLIVIADVSGHGAGSSMFTAVIATMFSDYKTRLDFAAPDFLQALNNVFVDLGKTNWHATVLVAEVNGQEVTMHNAGHPFPLLIPLASDRTVKSVVCRGDPIGVFEEWKAPRPVTISLENFDRLMFCTDRLIEARNDKDMEFGTVGLKKACMAARAGRSSEILEATIRQWRAYCGDVAAIDDLCLVVAEVPA